jgi:hypothetical protein
VIHIQGDDATVAEDRRIQTTALFRSEGFFVDASSWSSGSVTIEGQDLRREEEYEYFLTVRGVDVPQIKKALDGRPDEDVLELLGRHGADIVRQGEMHWLEHHSIPYGFHSY